MRNDKTYAYKGFKIITGQYLDGGQSYFWEVVGHYNTLMNDDKMWRSHERALESAKRSIDEYLGTGKKIGA